jgi:mRNA interferase MazF
VRLKSIIILSSKEINDQMNTVIIAPLTSTIKDFPFRLNCKFQDHLGQIALDHIRSVDKIRLVKRLGVIEESTAQDVCQLLLELFDF